MTDRVAAILFALTGVPTTLVMPFFLVWIAVNDQLPMMGGVKGLSGGPFEPLGPRAMALLGIPFVATSVLELVAARWLWRRERRGRVLGLSLLIPTEVFAIGYDLPIWHVLTALRSAALVAGLLRGR
ncbi:MAG TPA: hypothetical protein VFM06_02660 [Candidatus Limnocylindria bacterium]|nr:hypothetical protein [Candidatus Limnocylindria bacterium]